MNIETNDNLNQKETIPMDKYQAIVEKLSFAAINEQRRGRRWKIFFTFLIFLYLTPFLILSLELNDIDILGDESEKSGHHTAVVKLEGVISSSDEASAENILKGLKKAFKDDKTKGVILAINSPGGSPVQSAYIYEGMKNLRSEYPKIPLHVVVTDIAASGGYFVAVGGENIYVNKSSIVGSIGVRMGGLGFGFVEMIDKLGIERRLLTAGENKGLLDPFLPENEEQKQHLTTMLNDVHKHFKDVVIEGRGDRLEINDDIFSGLVWSGERALQYGLVDGFGSVKQVAKDVIGEEKTVDFTPKEQFFDRLATKISVSLAEQLKTLVIGSLEIQ